ncbi:DgyrCDS9484 [Dimorphilus gyrociliatus]|uniref:DgyrCDS9484 n=1 Tax=Dimorphilus gyrociliatus TaxID=2664684 RepID=A0A7I8VX35_9ANNE|nr:DgyrCDS9484 [Dimorphilus gyrociliatus]
MKSILFIFAALLIGVLFADKTKEEALGALKQMDESRRGIGALRMVMDEIETDISRQKRNPCHIGLGNTYQCALATLENEPGVNVNGPNSPGKRRFLNNSQNP